MPNIFGTLPFKFKWKVLKNTHHNPRQQKQIFIEQQAQTSLQNSFKSQHH